MCPFPCAELHIPYFTQSSQQAYEGGIMTRLIGKRSLMEATCSRIAAREGQSHNLNCASSHTHTTTLFCLSFGKQRDKDQLFNKQNGANRVSLFPFRNTEPDTRCKPPTEMYSKQTKELNIKSHVLGKYQKTEQNVYQMCGGGITSSALEAITEEGRLTDSNTHALISSGEGSVIKPNGKGHQTKKIAPTMRQLIYTMQKWLRQIKETARCRRTQRHDISRKATQEAIYPETHTQNKIYTWFDDRGGTVHKHRYYSETDTSHLRHQGKQFLVY